MESCFARGHQFFLQKAECIQQLGAATLEGVLRSREVKSDPMAVFMLVLLERYSESFTLEHKETIAMWEAQFCRISAEAQQRVRRTCAQAFARAEKFFAKFAAEIVQLQKQTLRDVVMSNQANSYVEWKQANNFFVRDFHLLTVEERDLLEDWEFVLCKMSTLEAVAFLSRLQRCFKRVESLLTEQGEALKKIGARNLQLALRSRHMLQFPMSIFARVFLECYSDELAAKQMETMPVWEEKLCEPSAADREAASAGRATPRLFGQHRVVEQLVIAGVIA